MTDKPELTIPPFDKEKGSLSCILLSKESLKITNSKIARVIPSEFHQTNVYSIQGCFKPISKMPL